MVFAMYHPAAALRTPAIERDSYADISAVPAALLDARRRREPVEAAPAIELEPEPGSEPQPEADTLLAPPTPADEPAPQLTLF
jgi:hypothetical protein